MDDATDPSLIGEICHIRAKSPGGPRFDPAYPEEFRNSYDNLLLMCAVHHKIVDDNPSVYPIENLQSLKADHEKWVDSQLSNDDRNDQSIKEKYSRLLEAVENNLQLSTADRWLSFMASDEYPRIEKTFANSLFDFPTWIVRQFWIGSIPSIEAAMLNVVQSLDDYVRFFVKYSSPSTFAEFYTIPKFYQSSEWNEEKYDRNFERWEGVIKETVGRATEVARALNLLIKVIRQSIDPEYRSEAGWFVTGGSYADENLSAAAVPRYEAARENEILSSARFKSIFNV